MPSGDARDSTSSLLLPLPRPGVSEAGSQAVLRPSQAQRHSGPSWLWGSAAVGGVSQASPVPGATHGWTRQMPPLCRAYQLITEHSLPGELGSPGDRQYLQHQRMPPGDPPQGCPHPSLSAQPAASDVQWAQTHQPWTECPRAVPSTVTPRSQTPPPERTGVRGWLQGPQTACVRAGTRSFPVPAGWNKAPDPRAGGTRGHSPSVFG